VRRAVPVLLGEAPAPPPGAGQSPPLPTPVFPRHPEKMGDVAPDPKYLPHNGNPYRTRVTFPMVARTLRGRLYP
jgi:hypothetical protein